MIAKKGRHHTQPKKKTKIIAIVVVDVPALWLTV